MGISRARVYELKNSGELPFYKDGSKTMFPVAGIEARVKRLSRISKARATTARNRAGEGAGAAESKAPGVGK